MTATSTSGAFNPGAFRRKLRHWYLQHGRHTLPWRLTRDPYAILVSEVMLQQTQVDRVEPYYHAWLTRWPNFESLASAPVSEVIRQWRGLGYNRRALSLHRLAATVVQQSGARLPLAPRDLRRLPGVGDYTAAAIRSFAREERVAVADTNISRVVARVQFGAAGPRELPRRQLQAALEAFLPRQDARGHNLALMDLGALVCRARGPACASCPVRDLCAWKAGGFPRAHEPARPTPKFESTARFARGRLVDALREGPARFAELESALPPPHRDRTSDYLRALERDGMVAEVEGGVWSLPGA